MPQGKKYTDAFKNWILQRVAMGACINALCREYGVSVDAVYIWRKQAKTDGRWEQLLERARRAPPPGARESRPPPGVSLHRQDGHSPWVGHCVMFCEPDPNAKRLPPGLGAISGERDREAAAKLKMLEKGTYKL